MTVFHSFDQHLWSLHWICLFYGKMLVLSPKIEIIYHEDMVAMVQSIIKIKEKINDDVKQYAFCGDCGSLINPAVSTEFFMKKIKDTLSQ